MKSVNEFLKEHKLEENTENVENTKNYELTEIEQFEKLKTKVLKYVLYKKRTEQEVRQKFSTEIEENTLEDIIQNLKDNNYINDNSYIERAVKEFMAIKTLSIKEIRNKLYSKGVNSSIIDSYFSSNEEKLENYEIACAKKIILKKQNQMEKDEIQNFLFKKGYKSENVKSAFEEIED